MVIIQVEPSLVTTDASSSLASGRGSRFRSAPAAWLLAFCVHSSGGAALAQIRTGEGIDAADLSLEDLMHVTLTTATKSEETIEESPSIVTVFSRRSIERLGARNLIDLLQHVPGFYEVAGQLGRNMAIRGIHAASAQHFVIMLDGLPVHDFLTSSSSPDGFSLDYAERVEIIRGPASAIYGASALMGVVNIITIDDSDGDRFTESFGCGTARSLRGSVTGALSLGEKGSILLSATYWQSNGVQAGVTGPQDVLIPAVSQNTADGVQAGENLTSPAARTPVHVNRYGPSVDLRAVYSRSQTWDLSMSLGHHDFHMQRTYRQGLIDVSNAIQPPRFVNDRVVLDHQRRIGGSSSSFGTLTLRASALYFRRDMRSQSVHQSVFSEAEKQGTSVIHRWRGEDLRLRLSAEHAVDLPDVAFLTAPALLAGVQGSYDVAFNHEMNHCYVDSQYVGNVGPYAGNGYDHLRCEQSTMLNEGMAVEPSGRYDDTDTGHRGDGDETRWGAFAQLSANLPYGMGLVIGGRIDHHPAFGFRLSPRFALVVPTALGVYAKAQVASAFVYPAFLYRTSNTLSNYVGNVDIAPQSIDAYELLVGYRLDLLGMVDFLRVELSGYYNRVEDFIAFDVSRNARTGRYLFSNQGDLAIVGSEASALVSLFDSNVTVSGSASFARPQQSTGDLLSDAGEFGGASKYPELLAATTASATFVRGVDASVTLLHSSAIRQDLADESRFEDIVGTDGRPYSSKEPDTYPTGMLLVNARVSATFLGSIRAALTATNLLDRRYYRPGAVLVPYLGEGRRVMLTVSHEH